MDKQQQIEKIAKILYGRYCAEDKCGKCKIPRCGDYCRAERLVISGIGDLRELGERIKLEFYNQFDELIPSIMSDKIDAIIKEMCGK